MEYCWICSFKKEVDNFNLAWTFFGRSYIYGIFLGLAESTAATLILFRRTRLLGLLLAFGIYVNVVLIDIEFDVKNAILHASIELLLVILLLVPYSKDLKQFFWDMEGKFKSCPQVFKRKWHRFVPVGFIVATCLFLIFGTYSLVSHKNEMVEFFEIENLKMDDQIQDLRKGLFTDKPMLFFEMENIFLITANDSSYWGNYRRSKDSLIITFNKKFFTAETLNFTWNEDNTELIGFDQTQKVYQLKLKPVEK